MEPPALRTARHSPGTATHAIARPLCSYSPAQTCDDSESYPGLYEVPIWDLTADGTYTMDPGK